MENEVRNIIALNSFKDSLTKKKGYGNDGFIFRALVTYDAIGKIVTEILEVCLIIGGYEPMIKLDVAAEGRIIIDSKYHLDFNPKFNNITFKFDGKIIVVECRRSPKIGDYKVIIEEQL